VAIGEDAPMERLTDGYSLIEGPTWDGGGLVFSDVHTGGVQRLDPSDRSVETVIPKRRGVGGIAVHADGGFVVSGRNIQHVRDGEIRVLYEDETAGGFNDLGTDARGRVYIGSLRRNPFADAPETGSGECYRIELDGSATQLYDDVGLTNGIGFSPDGSRMYHSDSAAGHVILHDVDGDELTNRRVFTRVDGMPDGLAIAADGSVWVACPEGGCVRGYAPDGSVIEEVTVPQRFVTSCAFGGDGLAQLFITTASDDAGTGSVYVTDIGVVGLEVPPARV